ncbi:MAG: Na+/H+ antiporter subunit E [Deferrisomatales bacterium]|nr:Na+/H+ antiporter subunit E [Deferrisomatales bacterium]
MGDRVSAAGGAGAERRFFRTPGRYLARVAGYGLVWWALAGGEASSWVLGAPAVGAAAALGLRLSPPGTPPWRAGGVARFLPYFLWQSLRGGFDVAQRALAPGPPLTPGLLHLPWRLPEGPARVLFANAVSLSPGTLSAALGADGLTVHVLDLDRSVSSHLAVLEARVAGVFGLTLPPPLPGEAGGG